MNKSPLAIKPLIDSFGRVHKNLRISVTDRCNIRCFYCMPEFVKFLPQTDVLTFEEIVRLTRIFAGAGIDRVRLTGGEPLVRRDVAGLIKMLKSIDGIKDIAITTNALLLAEQAAELRAAGLDRLNISLDTLDPQKFEQITRRKGLEKVLQGITVAQELGFKKIRLNTVAIAGLTESEIVPLAKFSRANGLELRFIEFMPLDGEQQWETKSVLTGALIRTVIEREIGPLVTAHRTLASQPAVDYCYADGKGKVGFIDPVSSPFCSACDRLRITAEGKMRNCLFSTEEWNLIELLRGGADDETILERIRMSVGQKKAGHGIDSEDFVRPDRAMYQIGG